jgi:hypothetical protein
MELTDKVVMEYLRIRTVSISSLVNERTDTERVDIIRSGHAQRD